MERLRCTWESVTSSTTGEADFERNLCKSSSNAVFLSDYCEPVDGVCVIDEEYMRGRKVFGHLVTVYRYGREEDEVMGVKFSKEMIIAKEQVYPMVNSKVTLIEN